MDCDDCGEEVFEAGVMVTDGDERACPGCGTRWMVSCDVETEPYLVRRDDDDSSRTVAPRKDR